MKNNKEIVDKIMERINKEIRQEIETVVNDYELEIGKAILADTVLPEEQTVTLKIPIILK